MERYECLKRRLVGVRGAYLLYFKLEKEYNDIVGSLGRVRLQSGYYVYIGSGLGVNGIWNRVKRHLDKKKEKKHWHIDYLSVNEYFKPIKIIVIETVESLEEKIALLLLEDKHYTIAYPRFGSTDKKSPTHLFRIVNDNVDKVINYTVKLLEEKLGKPAHSISI